MRSDILALMFCSLAFCPVVWASASVTEGGESWRQIAPDELEKLPEAQREEIVKRLTEEWTRIQRELEEDKVERNRLREEAKKRRVERPLGNRAPDSRELYTIDPLLKEANEMYHDFENRNREEVIKLFERYLESTPESEFTGEIYAKMGSMYSYNANVRKGENTDPKKMREYFQKAHLAYGGKYSPTGAVVYNYLTFMPGTLESRLAYYEWLLHIQAQGTLDDIYEIRSIGECAGGRAPEYSVKELEQRLSNAKNSLPGLIGSIEKQIFMDTFQKGNASDVYVDLTIIAKRYPNTELGRQAKHQIDTSHDKMGLYWATLEDASIMEEQLDNNTEGLNTAVGKQPEQSDLPVDDGRDSKTRAEQNGRKHDWFVPGNMGAVLSIMLVLSVVVTRCVWRRRPAQATPGQDE